MMKKRIFSLLLALVLCLSLVGAVNAGTVNTVKKTENGYSGNITVRASLSATVHDATATTKADLSSGFTYITSIIYYYKVNGHPQTTSTMGTTSAYAGCTESTGYKATSKHEADGGLKWGDWSGSLTAYAP